MPARSRLVWRLYSGLLGGVTALLTQRALNAGWKLVTGGEPPDVTDPDTPLRIAVVWASASAVGMIVSQLVMGRFTGRRWRKDYAEDTLRAGRISWHL